MKFLVNTKVLHDQLSLTEAVIPKSPMIPVLENFLFEITDGKLQVTVSDLQITCITSVSIEAKESGKMAIPAHIFMQTLQNLPEEIITISFDEKSYNVDIQSAKGRYKLSSENPSDFPSPPEIEKSFTIELSAELLHKGISRTSYAMSSDELRPAMNGLLVKLDKDGLTLVGTDGHRLVTYTKSELKQEAAHSIIIPRKAVQMLQKALKKNLDKSVSLQFNTSQACFQIAETQIICRLIDERYPDYEKVVPEGNKNYIVVDREEILDSLHRTSIYANKSTQQMRIKVVGEKFTLIVEDLDFSNEATEDISCTHEGEDIEMGFNVKFLIDVFHYMEEEKVRLELSDPNRAAIAIPVEESKEETEKNMALVMPIMLSN